MWVLAAAVCVALSLWLLWQNVKRRAIEALLDMAGVEDGEGVTKHRQIEELEEAGVRFRSEGEKHQFLLDCGLEASDYYYSHPFDALLADAGHKGLLDRVWSPLDRECVYEADTYAKHLEGLKAISRLPIEEIRGFDVNQVSFSLFGRSYTWKGKDNRDWMDVRLAGYLNWILDRSKQIDAGERFYLDNSHESPLYLFGTEELAQRLNQLPRLNFIRARK